MALEIDEKFQVKASVEQVWRFLLDARRVAPCLPGAELTQIVDERNFHGNMKVKIGPVTVVYKGRLAITEVDEAVHRVQMVGEATERGGAGSAKMTMESVVRALDGGTSEVTVSSKVDLVGRIVQYGRGLVVNVAKQLFKQFAETARAQLESEAKTQANAPPAAVGVGGPIPYGSDVSAGTAGVSAGTSKAVVAKGDAPPAVAGVGGPIPRGSDVPAETASGSVTAAAMATVAATATVADPSPAVVGVGGSLSHGSDIALAPLPPAAPPVRALPLVLKALWSSIANFFRRLFGRRKPE